MDSTSPNNDPRSVDELVSAALTESDEDVRWELISDLHWKGSAEVLRWSEDLCRSRCSYERRLGAEILGQLGVPGRTFPEESLAILLGVLQHERDPGVLYSALIALSHLGSELVIPVVARFAPHPDPEVRFAAVLALTGYEDETAVRLLIKLSRDSDSTVRDWATFGLGTQLELDTTEIRDALAARLTDADFDTRSEAFVGLARRQDPRVIAALIRELTSDCVGTLAIEAATFAASADLLPHLVALRSWWDVHSELLEEAIAACGSQA